MVVIPSEIIERIRERASLADIIGETVQLKRAGRNLSGLCPFHGEKTPSFSVNEEQGFYHCFGCGKSGDVFKFIQETRSLSFPEAVRFLANRYGIAVPEERSEQTDDRREKRDERTKLRQIVQAAMEIFHETLCDPTSGGQALKYLEKRGVSPESVRAFHIGYAPAEKNFITERIKERLKQKGQGALADLDNFQQLLIRVGLMKVREGETQPVDVFWDRLIFPICRSDGSPIAFGGRLIVPSETRPKYLNSPETPLYQKRQTLYGVPTAMTAMRKERLAFLVEGYMDVISMHQAGFAEALATCGTAVTAEHVKVLKRLVDRLQIVFDGDSAGRKAAAGCFPLFLNSGIDVSAMALPEGEDPDSLAQKLGHEKMEALLNERRRPLVDLYLDFLVEDLSGSPTTALFSSPTLAGKISERFAAAVRTVNNPVEIEFLLRRAADRLGVSFAALQELLEDKRKVTPATVTQSHAEMPPLPEFHAGYEESGAPRVEQSSGDRDFGSRGFGQGGFRDRGFNDGRFERRGNERRGFGDRNRWQNRARYEQSMVPPARPKTSEQKLSDYFQQLLIAVVSEPSLASGVLEIQSLQQDPETSASIPPQVRNFLAAVCELQGAGSFALEGEDFGERELSARIESFRALLDDHQLPADTILREALKQRKVGGSSPEKTAQELSAVLRRQNSASSIQVIKESEGHESDPIEKMRLAQEKLLIKRKETQMQRQGPNPTK